MYENFTPINTPAKIIKLKTVEHETKKAYLEFFYASFQNLNQDLHNIERLPTPESVERYNKKYAKEILAGKKDEQMSVITASDKYNIQDAYYEAMLVYGKEYDDLVKSLANKDNSETQQKLIKETINKLKDLKWSKTYIETDADIDTDIDTDDADDIFKTGADFDQGGKFAGAGAKLAGGATKLAGGLLKYGGAVAGVASLGEGIYGEVEAGGKEGDDTTQRVANWASTASSGLETVGTVLDFAGAPEVGVVLNIAGAVVGVGATVVDDIDSWFHDKKKKEDDQKQLQNQKEKGLAGVQGNPTYQNVGGAGETAGLSQSAVRVGG